MGVKDNWNEYMRNWYADQKRRDARKAAKVRAARPKAKPRLPTKEQLAKVLG